ncbi:hypothetical protein [Mucilaginibacter phyllosphaerae]
MTKALADNGLYAFSLLNEDEGDAIVHGHHKIFGFLSSGKTEIIINIMKLGTIAKRCVRIFNILK